MSDLLSEKQSREIIAELAAALPNVLGTRLPVPLGFPSSLESIENDRMKWDPVFTGGGIVCLLITDPAAPPPSRTKDIDIVLEIASYTEFIGIENPLRRAGFTQPGVDGDPAFVAWRWKGVRVDFLPHKPNELMTRTNRWFPYLIEAAERVEILGGKFAWCASAPCFLATKFEAFHSRGKGDFMSSKDIEDIIAVVDGRPELIDELRHSAHDIRGFVSQCCGELLGNSHFMDCLPRIVPDDNRETVTTARLTACSSVNLSFDH